MIRSIFGPGWRGLLAACAVAIQLAGCANRPPVAPGEETLRAACIGLPGHAIESPKIALPTRGAVIDSAVLVASTPLAVPAVPEHCRVIGRIEPVDSAAEPVRFQLNLPTEWNRKALQYGGGGYNGTLVTAMTPLRDAAPDDALPIQRGYATFGTDSGHEQGRYAPNEVGRFGLNDEMLTNYAFAAYKKVRDVAVEVMKRFYGQGPRRLYYFGGSEGGREGLTMAQRFPADYDGIVSVVPVVQLSMLFQSYLPHVRPQFDAGWLSPAKVATLARFVAASCDDLDGLSDGVVNQWAACPSRVDFRQLRCPGGADAGERCLSDAQLATLRATREPYVLPFVVANGLRSYPPSLLGNETTPDPQQPTMTRWITGTAPPTPTVDAATASQQWLYAANFVRFFVTRDPTFDARTFDPVQYEARLRELSSIMDSSSPDLSAFFARGGRLIMRENMGDLAQSPMAGIAYFESLIARLGRDSVDKSARLYLSPASTHSGHASSVTTGARVPTMADLLDPLDAWVTRGDPPPDAIVQVLKPATPPYALQAARPMCRYPGYPHFTGPDPRQASSYTCRSAMP